MTWAAGPMLAYDCESTGVDPETARIVTACVAKISGDSSVEIREWLVDPGVEIPAEATAVHGITTLQAQMEGIDPATAAAQIFAELDEAWSAGYPVVIYNASYDLTVLDRELRRHCGVNLANPGPVVDPVVIYKQVDKYRRGSRKLADVCAHYNVRLEGAHTAAGDCLAAARVAWRLAQTFPAEVGSLSLGELHERQVAWRAEWAAGFEEYLARKGTPERVDGAWPLRAVA